MAKTVASSLWLTQRDAWSYNSSEQLVAATARESIEEYNATREAVARGAMESPDFNSTRISWTRAVLNDMKRGRAYRFCDAETRTALYRPFFRQKMLWYAPLVEMRYRVPNLFPCREAENRVICVSGIGVTKDFSCIMTDVLPDLELAGKSQCFPLYWYEENENPEASLFGDAETNRHIRHDGVTDWALKEVRSRFGGSRAVTKEHIFYYVYGLLHSRQYRERFADDLKKSLPRLPIAGSVQDFMAFCKAGKELAGLHLNYEQGINRQAEGREGDYAFFAAMPMLAYRSLGVRVIGDTGIWQSEWTDETYRHFAVEKMRFAKARDESGRLVPDKTRIVYNGRIAIENIPPKAYEYVVNGKPAVEWVMERYAVATDKASQIKNDPNDWSREHRQPRYILDLLLSVILLSCRTADIASSLPRLKL